MVSGVTSAGTPTASFTAGELAGWTMGLQVPKEKEVIPGMNCTTPPTQHSEIAAYPY